MIVLVDGVRDRGGAVIIRFISSKTEAKIITKIDRLLLRRGTFLEARRQAKRSFES